MRTPPTDRKILKKIHDEYYSDFINYENDSSIRSSKIYVPIDCKKIADDLGVDGDIVFGRLYYHLNQKHGYTNDDGSKVHLFAKTIGEDSHAVNFPMLSALLAEHHTSWFRFNAPLILSVIALLVAVFSK